VVVVAGGGAPAADMGWRRGGGADGVARRWVLLLCVGSFCLGLLFTDRYVHVVHNQSVAP
jgi:hypothetical protein